MACWDPRNRGLSTFQSLAFTIIVGIQSLREVTTGTTSIFPTISPVPSPALLYIARGSLTALTQSTIMMLLLSALVCVLKVMASDVALIEPKPYFLSIITLVKDEGHTILELVQVYNSYLIFQSTDNFQN